MDPTDRIGTLATEHDRRRARPAIPPHSATGLRNDRWTRMAVKLVR